MSDPMILVDVRLYDRQPVWLKEMARRGGAISWRWDNPEVHPYTYQLARDLVERGLVKFVEVVSSAQQVSGQTYLQLTDLGRRVVDSLERAERSQSALRVDPAPSPDSDPPSPT